MMLVYSLPATQAIYERFGGIDGSAYFIGGFGMTALTANNIVRSSWMAILVTKTGVFLCFIEWPGAILRRSQ
jgi:hypothetical protein